MSYFDLKHRIGIIMVALLLISTAILVNTKDHFGFDISRDAIAVMVCAELLISFVVAIFWRRASESED